MSGKSNGLGPNGPKTGPKIKRLGPKSAKGKAASSKNAITHGAYSGVPVLPFEDPEEYRRHVKAYLDEHRPVGPSETHFVSEIAHDTWRKQRIKLAERSAFFERMGEVAYELDENRKKLNFDDDVSFFEVAASSDEGFDIELKNIVRDNKSAFSLLKFQPNTSDPQASLDERMKGARRDVRIRWKKYRRRLEREKGAITSLQNALCDFFLEDYSPSIGDRLANLANRRELREQICGLALVSQNTAAIERAESHLDARLKKHLNILFGLQDRREAKERQSPPVPHQDTAAE